MKRFGSGVQAGPFRSTGRFLVVVKSLDETVVGRAMKRFESGCKRIEAQHFYYAVVKLLQNNAITLGSGGGVGCQQNCTCH